MDSFMQFTQELHPESQPSDREQIGFLGIQGKTFPIYDGPNKIGRDPGSCSIALNNGTLSRLHAVINIVTSNGQRTINLMDIGSRNKTKVGLQVLQNFVPYPLTDGDTVQFGEVHGVFRVLQPKCDFPMTQDFAMTQDMPCTQEVSESPQINVNNNHKSNVIVPESPDVSDKDDSLIFKSPMLLSKNKPNLKSIQAKTLSKKLSDVAIANNFLNNTTKSMICDETNSKTVERFSNESNKSSDSDRTIVNDISKEKIDDRTCGSNKSIDSIFQADTQLPSVSSPSIHSLDTQIPTDANKSNDIDIEKEKEAFEDSLFNENDDIHIASTQIILKDTLKKFNSDISNINDAETQMFNNSDSNICELQTQVFGCDVKTETVSNLDTQVFGVDDVSSAQVFGVKDICDAETQMFPENKTIEPDKVIKKEKIIINNAETQFDSRDDEDFCNLNTQILAEDLAPTKTVKEISISKTSQEVAIRKPALVDSPDIIEDDFNDLNTQVLEVNEQLTPDLVVPETSAETTAEKPIEKVPEVQNKDKVESKTEDKDKEVLESDDEISFEAFKENDDEQYDISLSQNILGDSEPVQDQAPTTSKVPTTKDKTFKSPKPVTPRKKKPETKTVQANVVNDVDIADMCTQIVKSTSQSPAAFEEDEILTQCDISFEDMPTQVLTYEKALEDSQRRVSETLKSISVASLSKKSSGNTSGELENSSFNIMSPRKFIAMDLPDSQEIELNINKSSDVEDNMLTDSEQEPNTLENTPILYKSKPKNIKKEKKNDVKKSLDFTNVELPVRVMTRIRKPTARLIDADPESKKAVASILKPKVSDEVDTEILSENITRLKTKKNGDNDSTTLEVNKTIKNEVKPKKEIVKRESKKGSTKNDKEDKAKSEKTVKTEKAKNDDSKSKRNSSEKTTSKEEPKTEIRTDSRTSKRRSDDTIQDQPKDIVKPETSKKLAEKKLNSDSQNAKQKSDSQNTKEKSERQNTKLKSDSQNTRLKSDSHDTKEKSDSKNTKQTDKRTSKDTKCTKRRSNSVTSDETEPKRKRTRLEKKKDDDANKKQEPKRNTRAKKSDENKIDLPNIDTTRKNTKTDLTPKKTKEPEKSDRTTKQKDSDKTPTKLKRTKTDSIDLTALETKNDSNATKNERKLKGILKNVNQIDKYFVKEASPQNRIELRKRPTDSQEVEVKKRRVDSQRTSKNQKDVSTYKVLFTAFHNEDVKKKLVELGAVLVTEIKECDVLVTVQIKRTFKLLCAVGLGKPIVGPQWVQNCVDTGSFVDPWQYVIQDATTETKYKFNLKSTLKGKRNFLRGYKVSSTPSVNPKEDEMKQIVECSGGKWGTGGRKWLCVTSMLDKHVWSSLETKGATLLHVEFILHGALTQTFNVDNYKLTGK